MNMSIFRRSRVVVVSQTRSRIDHFRRRRMRRGIVVSYSRIVVESQFCDIGFSERRRYCVARRPSVTLSGCHAGPLCVYVYAALVSAAKVIRCIQCSY